MNVIPEEIRFAVCEDGDLNYFEAVRPGMTTLVGNIYLGRVQNVHKGIEAAFVDIGAEKNAFLYVGDTTEKLSHGQQILVQVTKEANGSKGAGVTMRYSLPGHRVVLMPTAPSVGVSRRIEREAERERLKAIAGKFCPPNMGVIFRTEAADASEEVLADELKALLATHKNIIEQAKERKAPTLLYDDADILRRLARDFCVADTDEIVLDDRRAWLTVRELTVPDSPDMTTKIKLYEGPQPIFAYYGIEREVASLSARIVHLPDGGYLVIDKTEALTVIDVNSGTYAGRQSLSETVFRLNMTAAKEILRQLRLRDIGGIIVVDFIDMNKPAHREQLLEYMREQANKDRAKTHIAGLTALGLVEITRKRTRKNFDSLIHVPCPGCCGEGKILSPESVEISVIRKLRESERQRHASDGYTVEVNPFCYEYIKNAGHLGAVAAQIGVQVNLRENPELSVDGYVIMSNV